MNINETDQGWTGGQGGNTARPAHRIASSLKTEQCGNRLLYHRLGCISSPYLPRRPCALQEGDESIDHPEPPMGRGRLGADKAEDSTQLQPF